MNNSVAHICKCKDVWKIPVIVCAAIDDEYFVQKILTMG